MTPSSNIMIPTESSPIHHADDEPNLPCCYPRWCSNGRPWFHGNPEALGWALDSVGRSVNFIGSASFLGTALIKLAKQAAGCPTEPIQDGSNSHRIPTCQERVYGIRPSSLLTTYTIVVGVISAILLPLMGAIVDYTPHRRYVARITSTIFCILIFPQIFIGENTWFMVAMLQIVVAFVGWAQSLVTFAYLPELSHSEQVLSEYTQSFTMIGYGSMVLYLAGVVGVVSLTGWGDVGTARFGQAVAFTVSTITLSMAWGYLLQPRPAARTLPPNRTVWSAGFTQIYHTSRHIHQHLPALRSFYLSVACIDAGINSLATIMITYLTDQLNFSSTENGITILLLLLGSIPGAKIAGIAVSYLNPIRGAMLATVLLTFTTVTGALVLYKPGQQIPTYILAISWGLGTGWKWTTDRLLASVLIPPGQDAELMGVYLFAGQILTWFPPLVFTILNEMGINQRVGIGLLSLCFVLGLLALLGIGNYREAVTLARGGGGGDAGGEGEEEVGGNSMDGCDVEATSVIGSNKVEESIPNEEEDVLKNHDICFELSRGGFESTNAWETKQ